MQCWTGKVLSDKADPQPRWRKAFQPFMQPVCICREMQCVISLRERQRNAVCLCGLTPDSCLLALSLQVARTINNMQQQIQQHQRQLAQALLMKQQPPPPHLSLHPSAGKSAMDSFSPHPQAPGLPDLQTKEQQSSPNTFAPYPPLGECPPAAAPHREYSSFIRISVFCSTV